ncbi:gamma-glutamylcyclotransferase [Leptothermofonsia sichuanensis E412]|uniref:allophanate hydrolase-related protein n=1 Tax=Leptothermofonsia sichuanensis TaxID=2917832 RepID=UPI001CA7A1A9|nr:gamma-glutamylcyclotransferase [Leptothermofonsia sichuanensis]QZZ22283.1 gamma-glutamylcyclotransferase [Leptothermofonsia sichuanensis E412]
MNQTNERGKRVFICGSALRGQPDHSNLQSATFVRETRTRPIYRMHSAQNDWHPAIYEVATGGISIPGEVYELSAEHYEQLLATEPPHMYPGDIVLEDGEVVTAILYPRELVEQYGWPDISHFGGWAAYKASKA